MKIIINENKLLLLKEVAEEEITPVISAKIDEIANVIVKVMLAFDEGTAKYLKRIGTKNRHGINLNVLNNIILGRGMRHPHPIDVTPWNDAKREYPKFKFPILYKCTVTKKVDEMNGDSNGNSNNMYYSALNRDVDVFFIGKSEIPDINSPEINFRNKKLKVFFNLQTYNRKVEYMEQYVKSMLNQELTIGMAANKERMVMNQNLPTPIKNIIEFIWLDKGRAAKANADIGKGYEGIDEITRSWKEFKEFFQENNDPNVWTQVNDELKLVGQEESNDISKIKILFFQKTNEKMQDYINKVHVNQENNYLHSDNVNPISRTLIMGNEYSITYDDYKEETNKEDRGTIYFKINRNGKLMSKTFMINRFGEVQAEYSNHWIENKNVSDYGRVFDCYNIAKDTMLKQVIPSRMHNQGARPIETEEDKEKLYLYKLKAGIEQDKAWK